MANILIVEDNTVSRRVIAQIVKRQGHEAIMAENGQEGLDVIQQQPVDLAIIDIEMPVMDGISLVENLRGDPSTKNIPIVMLTASGIDQDRIRAEQAGADGFLNKPASSSEVATIIDKLLNF